MVGKVAPNDLRQPTPLFGDRLVHAPPQLLLDLAELCLHAVAPGFPFKLEFPLRVCPQMNTKPRNLKVSGLPSPRRARLAAAKRPNSIRRVLSGCNDSENSSNRVRIASQKRRASASCSKPTTTSSAYLTMIISPVASRRRQRSAQRSNT